MRILTLTNCYPPHYYGGYELTCRDVMDRFRSEGHRVTVLTSTARVPGVVDVDEPGVHRTLTPYWDWELNQPRVDRSLIRRHAVERHNLAALREALALARPDVVSAWHMLGLSMSLLTMVERNHVPLVVTVANEWLIDGVSYDGWSRLWRRVPAGLPRPRDIFGVPVRLPSLQGVSVNFVSDFVKSAAVARSPWQPDAACPVIRPGIDLNDFPVEPRATRPWRGRLLYVGRVDPTKGVATLLRAVAKLAESVTLEVLGGGSVPYREQMQQLAAELGIAQRVHWDRVPREELRQRYQEADAVIFPSEWDEPFGLVPLEAMACGVPVIATRTGGSAEFLEDGSNCLAFMPADIDGLVGALARLADSPALRRDLAAAGAATARSLTTDRYSEELLTLHRRAEQGGQPSKL